MAQIEAIYNAGRWMVYCPVHGKDGAVLALNYASIDPTQSKLWTVGNEYICPVCYPGIAAEIPMIKKQRLQMTPDTGAQATARLRARAAGEIFEVVFPPQREQIEAMLKGRPVLMRNWDGPHETMEQIVIENEIVREIVQQKQERAEFLKVIGKERHVV